MRYPPNSSTFRGGSLNPVPGPPVELCTVKYTKLSGIFLEALGPLGAIVSAIAALADGVIFKFFGGARCPNNA